MNQIEWKTIEEYPKYEVSNTGLVRRIKTGRILKQSRNISYSYWTTQNKTYMYVMLRRDGKNYKQRVHRLVANAFIPNPNQLPTVNHIDNIQTNNNVSNLEWMTLIDNIKLRIGIKYNKEIYNFLKTN